MPTTAAPLSLTVLLTLCPATSVFRYPTVPLPHCSHVWSSHCLTETLPHYLAVPLPHCLAVALPHCPAAPCLAVTLPHCPATVPLPHCLAAHCPTVPLLSHCPTVSLLHCPTAAYCPTVSRTHCLIIPVCSTVPLTPCLSVSLPRFHFLTAPRPLASLSHYFTVTHPPNSSVPLPSYLIGSLSRCLPALQLNSLSDWEHSLDPSYI